MVARFAVGLGALIGAITLGSVRPDATTNLHSDSNEGSPGPKVLALVSIEQSLSIASLLWLDILQHVGQGSSLSKNVLRDVANLAFWAVDLDSRRFNFYHVPAILAATSGFPKLSDSLCERGVRNLPGRFEFDFLLGWNDYFIRGLPDEAADHWERAAQMDGAPDYLSSLAGRARLQARGSEAALDMLRRLIPNLPEGRQREMALQRVELIHSEKLLEKVDEACSEYRKDSGSNPASAGSLQLQGYISFPPVDTFGEPIELDFGPEEGIQPTSTSTNSPCVARTKMIPVREAEARANIGKMRRRHRGESNAD